MTLPFIKMAREHAESLVSALTEYNSTAVQPSEGPTFRDLVKRGREAGEQEESPEAKKAYASYEKALQAVNDVKKTLAGIGADLLGVDLESVGGDVTDEAKDEARSNRKELVATLKMLIESSDAEASSWAKSVEIPNVGSEKTMTLGDGGTARLRVWVDVVGPEGFSERYKSLSDFAVAAAKKDSGIPKPDVDKIRKAFEDASEEDQKNGISGEFADGWTVTVSPK